MPLSIDTNIIIDVVAGDDDASERAVSALTHHGSKTGLVLSPIVYAELFAHPGWQVDNIRAFLGATSIAVHWQLDRSVWERAGAAFAIYARRRRRQASAPPRRLMADFVIGAHALEIGGLLTSDVRFYRANFPDLMLLTI